MIGLFIVFIRKLQNCVIPIKRIRKQREDLTLLYHNSLNIWQTIYFPLVSLLLLVGSVLESVVESWVESVEEFVAPPFVVLPDPELAPSVLCSGS
ncbi:hypothetical protein D3C77_584290 [compost metagenome]